MEREQQRRWNGETAAEALGPQKTQNVAIWPLTETCDLFLEALIEFMGFLRKTAVLQKNCLVPLLLFPLEAEKDLCPHPQSVREPRGFMVLLKGNGNTDKRSCKIVLLSRDPCTNVRSMLGT